MTFYARDNYYFNNKNDALSSESRPINTTTYGYSSNNFETVQSEIYDAYGNVDCSISQAYNESNAVQDPLSSTGTSTMATGDIYSSSYTPMSGYHLQGSGVISSTNDNITVYNQPSDAIDYGAFNSTLDDYSASNNVYWDNSIACDTACIDSGNGRHTSMSGYGSSYHSSKMLPSLPIKHSNSMLDGMYTGMNKSGQRIGACLPTTPPPGMVMVAENSKCRMLPQAVTYQNVQRSSDVAAYQNLNGHAGYATGYSGVCARDVGNGKSLPAVPLRMLSQSRSSLQYRQLFEDTKATTSSSGDLYTNQYNTYDNSTINNYSSMIPPRAHTSMLPIDYTDYADDGYNTNNADNLSTYSDTPPLATTQQKLQQQRKLSLMMAMTTASVIASGETRIPLQLAKKKNQQIQQKDHLISATATQICSSSKTDIDNSPLHDNYMFEYISSGNASSKRTLNGTESALTTDASVVVAITTAATLKTECYTNTTTSTNKDIRTLSYESHSNVTSTSRKLPKRLPTPQYKAPLNGATSSTTTTTTEKPFTNVNNSPSGANNGRMTTKQLPKLPIQHQSQQKQENTLPKSNLHSPISSSSSITNTSASALTFASTSVNSAPTLSNLETLPAVQNLTPTHSIWNDASKTTKVETIISTTNGINNPDNSLSFEQAGVNVNTSSIGISTRSNIDDIFDSSGSSSRNSNININNVIVSSLSPSSSSPMKVAQTSASDHIYNTNISSFETTIKTTPLLTSTATSVVCTTASTTTTSSTTIESLQPFDIAEYLKPYSLPALSYGMLDDNSKLTSVSTFVTSGTIASTTNFTLHGSGNGKFLDNQIDEDDDNAALQVATESTTNIVPTLPLLSTYSSTTRFSTITSTTPSAMSPTVSIAVTNDSIVDFPSSMSKDVDTNISCLSSNFSFPPDKVTTAESTKGTLSFITTAPATVITTNAISEITTTLNSDMSALNSFTETKNTMDSICHNASDISEKDGAETLESSLTMQSYADYMKKFELPELPSLATISNFEESDAPPVSSTVTTLPSYITDFMNSDFTLPTLSYVTDDQDQTTKLLLTTTDSFATYTNDTSNSISYSETLKTVDNITIGLTLTNLDDAKTTASKIAESSGTAFDDSFYDSFNVDLSALTAPVVPPSADTEAKDSGGQLLISMNSNYNDTDYTLPTITSSFSTPFAVTEESYVSTYEAIELKESIPEKRFNTHGGYYKPSSTQPSTKEPLSVLSTTATVTTQATSPPTSQTQQKSAATAAATAAAAAGKATSMLGGLSKGLKDGLDGVLSGSGSNSGQQPNLTKKGGFGFNLASKLVPNVSGLLSTKTQAQSTTTNNVSVINTTATLNATATTSAIQQQLLTDYNVPYTISNGTMTPTNEPVVTYVSGALANPNVYGDFNEMMYSENLTGMDGYEDEYGYSEFPVYHTSGKDNGRDIEFDYSKDQLSVTTASDALAITSGQILPQSDLGLGMTYQVTVSTMGSDMPVENFAPIVPANKSDSSLISSQANVTSVHSSATPAVTSTKKSTAGGGGGMFGSFLGKAAAAVQSATQVVNQGASMASSVVQKVPIPSTGGSASMSISAASTTSIPINAISEPNAMVTTTSLGHHPANYTSTMSTIGYDLAMNNDYNSQLLINQDSLSSQYSTTGDDYENSNMLTYTTASPMIMTTSPTYIPKTDNKVYSNYYSNGNQSQLLHSQSLEHEQEQTVPPAGSSGKKLPTINGKSGYLIKQQPTEIFDDEDEFIDDIDHDPTYCIDSEQNDYYMDQQQTTPSRRTSTAANGYYEHTNGSYDYREDYFNEEDEYKYLEKEEQQKMEQDEMLLHQQYNEHQSHQQQLLKQQQKPLHHSTKLSSLEYIDDLREDSYIDDNYQSEEDSGNYLDESSGGSVGGAIGATMNAASNKTHLLDETVAAIPTTATVDPTSVRNSVSSMQANVSAHLQIKKQDSIIMEEDEDEEELTLNVSNGDMLSPGRKSSILDEEDEDDTLPDLNEATRTKIQKKKVLMRGETEEVVSGHMHMMRKPEITAKQRWHWAYNKIILQLNVSKFKSLNVFYALVCIFLILDLILSLQN